MDLKKVPIETLVDLVLDETTSEKLVDAAIHEWGERVYFCNGVF